MPLISFVSIVTSPFSDVQDAQPRGEMTNGTPNPPDVISYLSHQLAQEYFERFSKDQYQTEVEGWRLLQSARISSLR